ncbi:MAG TPA: carbamoyltransferase [Thermoanaerobaculia bacterium]|nr:carbamoyltransferase [Thermoanaerobaculia bacterium]
MWILGLSAYYHDSAAALLRDGDLVAACQEERLSRLKNDASFPIRSIQEVLSIGGISIEDLACVVFYDKPLLKFDRLLETYVAYAPSGLRSFLKAMPVWLKEKLHVTREIRELTNFTGPILYARHHESHAASAFYPSPFDEAAVVCFDGVGEWATTTCWKGNGRTLELLNEIHFPHSLGLLYSAFTYYTGFKVNSGEYKVMGLAPYGKPRFASLIRERLIDLKDDGSFRLDMKYFNYCQGLTMTNNRFHDLFGGPPRSPEGDLTERELDLAASIQVVTEDVMLSIVRHVHRITGLKNLCLAGGVALNCVGNGRIMREGPFEKLWIQPAAGDAGGAAGAAWAAWHGYFGRERTITSNLDGQNGSYLGPRYTSDQIENVLVSTGCHFERLEDDELLPRLAEQIAAAQVVGWFDGALEFGPRALGARSIIGDARNPEMQKRMNLKIKNRESFRPFAPAVLAEEASKWFSIEHSPYMMLVAQILPEHQIPMTPEEESLFGIDKLNVRRSTIPAVTHIDYSARVQTVHRETNPRFHQLLRHFYALTGCPVIVNTSFNVRGEPIVCTPEDAYRCFLDTQMDSLVLGPFLIERAKQPSLEREQRSFPLD